MAIDFSPIANMRPFRLADAVGAGQTLAANQFRLNEAQHAQQARGGLREAVSAGTPEAMDQYRKQFPQEARQWEGESLKYKGAALDFKLKQLDMLSRLASGVKDQATYEQAKKTAQELEIDVSGAPPQYDPNWVQQVQTQILSTKDRVSMAKDAWERDFKEREQKERERHNRATEQLSEEKNAIARRKTMEEKGLKASDYNAVWSRVTALFGGVYDPMTGRVTGLDKDQTARAVAIGQAAETLYLNGRAKTPADAAAQAAQRFGVEMPAEPPAGAVGAPGSGLPQGIPQGSRQVGTSGGKPVYEAPDGKRYIVE